jgi:hypothetical protein
MAIIYYLYAIIAEWHFALITVRTISDDMIANIPNAINKLLESIQ